MLLTLSARGVLTEGSNVNEEMARWAGLGGLLTFQDLWLEQAPCPALPTAVGGIGGVGRRVRGDAERAGARPAELCSIGCDDQRVSVSRHG
jgi:hypothetical protein